MCYCIYYYYQSFRNELYSDGYEFKPREKR